MAQSTNFHENLDVGSSKNCFGRSLTYSIRSKTLLFVIPHFEVFISDQIASVKPFFGNVGLLMPMPRFSKAMFCMPFFRKYFRFLELSINSVTQIPSNYRFFRSQFFTLPVETIRKRNCYLAARSSIKTIFRNSYDFDIIHAHFLDVNGFVGVALKDFYNKPLILTAHGYDVYELPFKDSWHNSLARYVLTEADQVITVSNFCAEKLSSLGVSSSKVNVIPNGYDELLFKPASMAGARKKLGLPLAKKMLLSVGSLEDVKGHRYLIDAMSMVLKKRSDVLLVIVGDGSLKTSLEKKIRELGMENRVLLTGRKRHAEVPLWMNACDVFVLPSLNESFGVVIIEALACGKPVVATCVGGVSEIIANEDVGILVKPAHPPSLYRGILDALNRKWTPTNIALYARRYSWANIIPSILRVYDEALNSSSD